MSENCFHIIRKFLNHLKVLMNFIFVYVVRFEFIENIFLLASLTRMKNTYIHTPTQTSLFFSFSTKSELYLAWREVVMGDI